MLHHWCNILLDCSNLLLVLFPTTINPLAYHLSSHKCKVVPTSRLLMIVSACPRSLGVFDPFRFPFPFPLPFLWVVHKSILSRANMTNLCLSASVFFPLLFPIQSLVPAHSAAILSHTAPRLCHPHLCFHSVWTWDLPSFLLLTYCSTMWYFSISEFPSRS